VALNRGSDSIEDIYELSPLQEGMLFHSLYEPRAGLYVQQFNFRLPPGTDLSALETTWQELIARYPVLRTSFHWEDLSRPLQVLHRRLKFTLNRLDWQHVPAAEQKSRLSEYLNRDRGIGFDLSKPPLMRVVVIQLPDEVYRCVWSFHHILLDGWSVQLLVKDLEELYEAASRGEEVRLSDTRPYRDYIQWLKQRDLSEAERFWRKSLKGFTAPTPLHVDEPVEGASGAQAEYGSHQVKLSKRVSKALETLARQQRLTLNTLVQGAWAILLSRYSGEPDVVFGGVVSGRPATLAGVESMVGLFINTLPVRARLSPERPLLEWLKELQRQQLETRDYEYSPMLEIQKWSELPAAVPLFDSIVVFENFPTLFAEDRNRDEQDEFYVERTNYPLCLVAIPGAELRLWFYYQQGRFQASTVERMGGHVRTLLEAMAANPQRGLGELPLLTQREQRQMLVEWNQTGRDSAGQPSLVEQFERQAAATPEATAFVCRNERLTYRELNQRANRVAGYLGSLGVGPEVVVGVCLERGLAVVGALMGVLKAGGGYLPLDPSYPGERLGFMAADAGAAVVLTEQRWAGMFTGRGAKVVCLEAAQAELAQQGEGNGSRPAAPEQMAYVIYTSGSTGRPKGVVVEHKQVLNRLAWMWEAYPFGEGEVCCQKTALNFVDSMWELLGPLLVGVGSVIVPDEEVRDPYALVARLGEHGVTRLWVVPSLLRALLEAHADLQERLPALRFWVSSGEALPVTLLEEFQRAMPESRLYNLYGTSEVWDVTWCEAEGSGGRQRRVAIGRPIRNTRVYVLDGEGRPVPIGVPGELHVGGVGLARGYIGLRELTEAKFIADRIGTEGGGRLYKTGDLVRYRENGELEFLGRLDHQAKIRGFRVELGEIESVLMRHPHVRQAVVTVREYGGDPRLVAYLLADRAANGPNDQIRSIVALERLSQWQEVWDNVYRQPAAEGAALDTAGWLSSATGSPFSAEEIEEHVSNSEERVLALNPQNVLDIGCGLGLLLFRLAGRSMRYCATDFSAASLDRIEQKLAKMEVKNVTLLCRPASDFSGFETGSFDTVVLNSVVQYFPDVNYLFEVLDGVFRILQPGGAIFIGDVRNLPLLEMFHWSIEQHRVAGDLTADEIHRRVQKRISDDEQLAIAPGFFHALRERYPQISRVHIELKRGHYRNELTRFRYDVTLRVGLPPSPVAAPQWLDWQKEQLTVADIRKLLLETEPRSLGVRRVYNDRMLLEGINRGAWMRPAADPEEFWTLRPQTGYSVRVSPSDAGFHQCFDALFSRGEEPDSPSPPAVAQPSEPLTNEPMRTLAGSKVIFSLRRYLQSHLPDHMIPSAFSMVDSFPLTPNGKVDRAALPEPDLSFATGRQAYTAPRTRLEETLRGIWADVLAIDNLGVDDNFFALGGHSLIATRLISRLRDAFRVELALRAIFDHPTIAELARAVEEAQECTRTSKAPVVARLPREQHSVSVDAAGNVDLSEVRTMTKKPLQDNR